MTTSALEHRTRRIRDLVSDYRTGRLVVPEFQREYVWKPGRAPTLLDSLYRGWPISSLLIWHNEDVQVETRRAEPKAARGSTKWLIDGQQRVITLARLSTGDEGIEVIFNPQTDTFARPNAATRQDASWASVTTLWDDEEFRDVVRSLPDSPNGRRTHERLERVRQIRDYEVPVVEMINHNFRDAVGAFSRINTLGYRLKKQDIESAQVAAQHSGFIRRKVAPFLASVHREGFTRLHVMHLFRACAFIAHPDGRNRTPLHELERRDVDKAWSLTERATEEALGVVRSEFGLVDMTVLWSGALIVPVIAMCARIPPRDRKPREMAGWLALAALHHRYSGAAETALEEDLRACRADDPVGALLKALRGRNSRLSAREADFSGRVNDRSALLASWIACKARGAYDPLTGSGLILQKNIDRHHILPRARFDTSSRAEADTIANIAFISGTSNRSIGDDDPAIYLARAKPRVLDSQCIPNEKTLWNTASAASFWAARRKRLAQAFNDFVSNSLQGRRIQ